MSREKFATKQGKSGVNLGRIGMNGGRAEDEALDFGDKSAKSGDIVGNHYVKDNISR